MNSSNFVVVLDACVLYPAPLRDLLMSLAVSYLFRAKWTENIHAEWKKNLLKNRSNLKDEQLLATIALMNEAVPDSLVDGYEELIPGLSLPDNDDRHVLAAAIVANAQVIVTFNLKDFPISELEKYNIEAQHPDEFLLHLLSLDHITVIEALKKMRQRLKNPPKSASEFVETLHRQNIPLFSSEIKKYEGLI